MYNLNLKILHLIIYFGCSSATSQNLKVSEAKFDSVRNATEELSIYFPDSAVGNALLLIQMAKASNIEQQYSKALSTSAKIKIKAGLIDEAITDNQNSTSINERLKNQMEIAKNYSIEGQINHYKANYVEATKFYLKSLSLCEKLSLNKLSLKNNLGLAKVCITQKKFTEVLAYLQKAVALEKLQPNGFDKAEINVQLGYYYSYMEDIALSEKYFGEAYSFFEDRKQELPMAFIMAERSNLYYKTDPLKAIEIQLKAQKIFNKIAPNSLTSAFNMVYLGESLFELAKDDSLIKEIKYAEIPTTKQKLIQAADVLLLRGLELTKKLKNTDGYLSTNSILADMSIYKGDYKTAIKYYQSKFKYTDSLFSQKNKNAIAKFEAEKDLVKLNAENQQKATLNKILIASTLALLAFGFIVYRNLKNRKKISDQLELLQAKRITELETEKQLQAVDAMLQGQEEERSRLAKDLHDGLGGMLSGVKISFSNMKENLVMDASSAAVFERSINQLDNSIRELRKVAHNLMPEALVKFGLIDATKDFCNTMALSSNVKINCENFGEKRILGNTADIYIYRIVQELVNNAIKHAAATQILVQLSTTNNRVLITVEDDGKGFDKNILDSENGIGLSNIKHRVDYFKGKIEINSKLGAGTSINIELTTM